MGWFIHGYRSRLFRKREAGVVFDHSDRSSCFSDSPSLSFLTGGFRQRNRVVFSYWNRQFWFPAVESNRFAVGFPHSALDVLL